MTDKQTTETTVSNITTPASAPSQNAKDAEKPFVKRNFIYMAISLLLIVVGFLLMTGSSNNNPAEFNTDIFSARRIIIGPGMAFIGFVAMAFAILYTPKRNQASNTGKE
jgi:hypothetical protein